MNLSLIKPLLQIPALVKPDAATLSSLPLSHGIRPEVTSAVTASRAQMLDLPPHISREPLALLSQALMLSKTTPLSLELTFSVLNLPLDSYHKESHSDKRCLNLDTFRREQHRY